MRQRFIQSFSTSGTEQTAIENKELGKPYVAYIEDGQYIDWNTKGIDYTGMPLTIQVLENGDFTINRSNIYYNVNSGGWQYEENPATIHLLSGDTVSFKCSIEVDKSCAFSGNSIAFVAYGNIASLGHMDDFQITTVPGYNERYSSFFSKCTGLVDVSNLVLPFYDLTGTANFYSYLFQNCSELLYPPKLNATSLAVSCYQSMFENTKISSIVLPALTLAQSCYRGMFAVCKNLTNITCLATDITSNNCTKDWLYQASSTGTFIKHPNTTWPRGNSGIPNNWTVIDADI